MLSEEFLKQEEKLNKIYLEQEKIRQEIFKEQEKLFLELVKCTVRINSIIKIEMRNGSGYKFKVEKIIYHKKTINLISGILNFEIHQGFYNPRVLYDKFGRPLNIIQY